MSLLFVDVGSVVPAATAALAVLLIVPVAPAATVAVAVNVATAPLLRLMARLMFPLLPLAGVPQLPVPVVIEQPHVTLVRELGKVSVTVAPVTLLGPLFVTVIV